MSLLEQLEGRWLLTISTPALGVGNDVMFNGDGVGEFVEFQVRSDGYLQHNLAGKFGFESAIDLDSVTVGEQARRVNELDSFSFIDDGLNDQVRFNGSYEFEFNSANVTVDAGEVRVFSNVVVTTGAGLIDLNANVWIDLQSGSSLATIDGGIQLTANPLGVAVGNAAGIWSNGSIQSTGTGNISMSGTRGTDATSSMRQGVSITGGLISSTASGQDAGTITILGTGAVNSPSGDTSANGGVLVSQATITSRDGAISIMGQGGSGTGFSYDGVVVSVGSVINSIGEGDNAASILIDGTSGFGQEGDGVRFEGNTVPVVSSIDGDIVIVGRGADSGEAGGIHISRGRFISSGTGDGAAAITLVGVGGNADRLSHGIELEGFDTEISSIDGDISISGTGGANQHLSRGLFMRDFQQIASTGTSALAAKIALTGIGGGGSGEGILFNSALSGDARLITSVMGDISISAQSSTGTAINANSGDLRIQSTGTGDDAAKITIESGLPVGGYLSFSGSESSIETVDGDILISATAAASSVSIGVPITSANEGRITVEGARDNATSVTLSSGGILSSANGDILVTGTSGSSSFSQPAVNISGTITSTGSGAGAAMITINGSAQGEGADGVRLTSTITSEDGAIEINGTGGGGSGVGFYGDGTIRSTGTTKATAATIRIDAHGSVTAGGAGVVLIGGSSAQPNLSTVAGDVFVNGTGGFGPTPDNHGVWVRNGYVESMGTIRAESGTIDLRGNGGTSTAGNAVGVLLESSQSRVTSVAGQISFSGNGRPGTTATNYAVAILDGSVVESTGVNDQAATIQIGGNTDDAPVLLLRGGRVLSAGPGIISLGGHSLGGMPGIVTSSTNNVIGGPTASGDITLGVDAIELGGTTEIRSTGDLTIQPTLSWTSIGLGEGSGTLNLDDIELAMLADGFRTITIGNKYDGTGTIDLETAAFNDPVIIAGGVINDHAGADIDAGANPVTLIGTISPGQSPGVLSVSGDFTFADGDTFEVEIGGASSGDTATSHDQLDVIGTVTIGTDVTLNTSSFGGFTPLDGQQFVIVNNDGTDPVSGTFAGLPEGALIPNFLGPGVYAQISYLGLDGATGNDVVLTAGTAPATWTQLGSDIDGEAAGDQSGYSVAMSGDGNTIVVGAPSNDGNGNSSGLARVYRFNGNSWSQLGNDIDGESAGDESGLSVAMSEDGNVIVVGAAGNDGNGHDSGHARVYRFDGSSWSQLGSDIDGEAVDDQSGRSVSMSGDGSTIVVGAAGNDGNGHDSGHARVYRFDGSSWSQLGSDIDGEAVDDQSGRSVSMSGDGSTIVVGATGNDGNGYSSGHARVYRFDGSTWNKLGSDIDGEAAFDLSGYSVAMNDDGNVLVVGAVWNDGNGYDSGHARVYRFDGSSWSQLGSDIDGEAVDDLSGRSVSMSGDGSTIVVGAFGNDGIGEDSGHARVYHFDGSNWSKLGSDIDGESPRDNSGTSVAMSSDGNTITVGAISNGGNGHARVYRFLSNDTLDPLLVTSTLDTVDAADGVTTLREAITYANETPGTDTITFHIPGAGPHTIQPLSQLPDIVEAVILDGTTQPGFSGTPVIELDGADVIANGLTITGGGTTVRGLAINRFGVHGIELANNGGNTIEGNFLGTDTTGTLARGNQTGVFLNQSSDNVIGSDLDGTNDDAERNLISGNRSYGIYSFSVSNRNSLAGNYVGTDVTGMSTLGNGQRGIVVAGGADTTVRENVVSGNGLDGILLSESTTTGVVIQGNKVGTDATGTQPVGNGNHGIFIAGPNGVTIGGTGPGEANTIAFNTRAGVSITGTRIRNRITGNSIFGNGDLGIDLMGDGVSPNDPGDGDTGANQRQNFPLLSSAVSAAGSTQLAGSLQSAPQTQFTLEFFSNAAADPSGYGEGQIYLGSAPVTSDENGDANFSITLPGQVAAGHVVTATATDPLGNTSEFSQGLTIITNHPPVIISLDRGAVNENSVFNFGGAFTDLDLGDLHRIELDWGDGSTTTLDLPQGARTFSAQHLYLDDATYSISVSVLDNAGGSDHGGGSITVFNVVPNMAAQDDETIHGYEHALLEREVTFVDDGSLDLHVVTVDYGDGLSEQISVPVGQRSVMVRHTYVVTPGSSDSYPVTVEVSDDDGGSSLAEFAVTVADQRLSEPDQRPTIEFTSPSYSVTENGGKIVLVEATLSSPATERLEVPVTLVDGSATSEMDYQLNDTVFVFEATQTLAQLTFSDIDDAIDEAATETATLTIDPLTPGVLMGTVTQTELRVLDNDARPVVYFKQANSRLKEGDDYDLTVELSAVSSSTVIVPIQVLTGTTGTADDYTLSTNSIQIAPGNRSAKASLSITDDTLAESSESLRISIGQGVIGAGLSTKPGNASTHTSVIEASDNYKVSLSTGTPVVFEGDGSFDVVAQLDAPAANDIQIPLTISSFDAKATDYSAPFTHISVLEGESSGTLTITLTDDSLSESRETINVGLSNLPPNSGLAAGGQTLVRVVIEDDDRASIQFSSKNQTVFEDEGTIEVSITTGGVTFPHPITIPVTVRGKSSAAIVSGSSRDISGFPSSITIPANSTMGTMVVDLVDDSSNEINESFEFVMGTLPPNLPNAEMGYTTIHTLTVRDDDPLAYIAASVASVTEDADVVSFTVTLSAATNAKAKVPFDVFGSALRNTDYTLIEETKANYKVSRNYVEINAGKRQAVIRVKVLEDSTSEATERVGVSLETKYGSHLLTNAKIDADRASASFTIANDDGTPVPTISAIRARDPGSKTYVKSTWIYEGGSFQITVSMANPAYKDVYVPISFPDEASGRCKSNEFSTRGLSSGKLRIPAGKTSADFYIDTVNDKETEGNERIRIKMGQPVDSKGNKFGKINSPSYKEVGVQASDPYTPVATAGTLQIGGDLTGYPAPSDSSSEFTPAQLAELAELSGFIIAGYLDGTSVFLDGNLNGTQDFVDFNGDGVQDEEEPDEPSASTSPDGALQIVIPAELDRNGDGLIGPDEAQLVAVGGIDTSTGLPRSTRLIAAPGDYVATPLTTLSAKLLQQHGYELGAAHERVLESFDLPTFEIGTTAVPHATLAGDLAAASSYPLTIVLENTAIIIGRYLAEITGIEVEYLADVVYRQLASLVAQPETRIGLSDPFVLENLLNGVASEFGYSVAAPASAVIAGLAEINAELLALPVTTNMTFLESVMQRKIVARSHLASDAALLAGGSLSELDFSARYSGQSLQNLISAAQPQSIVPVSISVSDAELLEGDDGISYAAFTVTVSDHFEGPLSVQYTTESDTASDSSSGAAADYQPVSGQLLWHSGDAPTQTILVPVFGDTAPELDEVFYLHLSQSSSGVIAIPTGRGLIRGDDAIVIQMDDSAEASEIDIDISRDWISVYQDGREHLDGPLNPDTPLTVQGSAAGPSHFRVNLLDGDSARTIHVRAGSLQDSLHVGDVLSTSTSHVVLGPGSGRFDADTLIVTYADFAQATDDHSPSLQFSGSPEYGQVLRVDGTFPTALNTEEVLLSWNVIRNGSAFASGTDSSLEFIPDAPGEYSVTLLAELIDGTFALAQETVVLENVLPVVSIDSVSSPLVEGTLISVTGSGSDLDSDDENLSFSWNVIKTSSHGQVTPGFATGTGSSWSFAPDDNGIYEIALTVTDKDGGSSSVSQTISVDNVPPTLSVSGESSVDEGATYTLNFSSSDPGDDSITEWTIDWGDGVVETVPGNPSSVTHVYADGPNEYVIGATSTDEDGTYEASGLTTVQVDNATPRVGLIQLADWSTDVSLAVSWEDPGVLDTHSISIDWGDGNASEYSPAESPAAAVHEYETGGVYTIIVTVTDNDGDISSLESVAYITGARLHEHVLQVVGARGNDNVLISKLLGKHRVTADFLSGWLHTKSFVSSQVDRIDVYLGDGNDIALVTSNIQDSVLIHGGQGNDVLDGGSGDDILIGGDGDDLLHGGKGDDVLIGGLGADWILGNQGDDLLIGGYTAFDNSSVALFVIAAEWNASKPYQTRVENLRGTNADAAQFAGRQNFDYFLVASGPDRTVFDDGERDYLIGDGGQEWFFANLDDEDENHLDSLLGLTPDELVDLL